MLKSATFPLAPEKICSQKGARHSSGRGSMSERARADGIRARADGISLSSTARTNKKTKWEKLAGSRAGCHA